MFHAGMLNQCFHQVYIYTSVDNSVLDVIRQSRKYIISSKGSIEDISQ